MGPGREMDAGRVRNCVNPAHLEPVTQKVNVLRGEGASARNAAKTHCDYGHELTKDNTYVTPDGRRNCRTCKRRTNAQARARRAAKIA